ncbi:hypothetical protein ACS0TY_035978 [Phlomoides rotata]
MAHLFKTFEESPTITPKTYNNWKSAPIGLEPASDSSLFGPKSRARDASPPRPKSSVANGIYESKDVAFSVFSLWVALGRKYSDGEGGRKYKKVLEELGVLLGAFNVKEFIPCLFWMKYVNGMTAKVREIANDLDEFLEFVVKEHMDGRRTAGNGEGGFVLDAISIKALILDMFAAGMDTTFTLIEWTLSELIRNANVMSKLKTELKNIAGSNSSITLDKCGYLKAVVKETLRLHPPLPLLVPRESSKDVKVLSYDIAAGTRMVINVWAIGRDPLLWEDLGKFWPERFLNSSVDFKGQFRLIPLGVGRRGCPGAAFALGIVELALANLVLSFEFALPGGARGEDLDMVEGNGITIHRKLSLFVIASCDS